MRDRHLLTASYMGESEAEHVGSTDSSTGETL
jgi:hypothetical protein